jgi:hypothetical protein
MLVLSDFTVRYHTYRAAWSFDCHDVGGTSRSATCGRHKKFDGSRQAKLIPIQKGFWYAARALGGENRMDMASIFGGLDIAQRKESLGKLWQLKGILDKTTVVEPEAERNHSHE